MKKVNLFLLAAGALTMTACSSNEKENDAVEAPVEIRLSSGLTMQGGTRAVDDTPAQAEQIVNGEKVYVWVDDKQKDVATLNQENYITKWELTANGSGGFTGNTKYYPATGGHINVYCIHGNFSGTPFTSATNYPVADATWTHTVETDQSVAGNYEKSDLLYGSKQDLKRQSTAHNILFKHKLSKIEVLLKQDAASNATVPNSKLKNATVYVQNTKNTATFTFTAKAGEFSMASNAEGYQTAYNSYGGTVAATGTEAEITMKKTFDDDVSDTDANYDSDPLKPLFAEAIIVPQTVNSGTKLLRIHLAEGGDLFATLASNTEFEPGKKYTYTVTVSLTGITLRSTVTNWDQVTGNINASMDDEQP